jgi:hypothetical protein
MALYPADLPWLHKPAAVHAAARVLVASALNQRSLVAYLDFASHPGETSAGTPYWEPPRSQSNVWQAGLRERLDDYLARDFDAPENNVALALAFLATVRSSVPIGSFVFVLSDFIEQTALDVWGQAVNRGWDVVPVIVQDPVWEQSFPPIAGVVMPLADARGEGARQVRLDAREVEERRRFNSARLELLQRDFVRLGLDSVVIDDGADHAVHAALLDWAEGRLGAGRGTQ